MVCGGIACCRRNNRKMINKNVTYIGTVLGLLGPSPLWLFTVFTFGAQESASHLGCWVTLFVWLCGVIKEGFLQQTH